MSLRAKVKKAMAPKGKQSKDLLYLLFSQPALLAIVISTTICVVLVNCIWYIQYNIVKSN